MNRLFALWETTVGKKVAMAVTGIVMILFLISHMISNVLIFRNPAASRQLRRVASLARPGALDRACRAARVRRDPHRRRVPADDARPPRAARSRTTSTNYQVATYASRTMRWGGVLLAVFIVFHILHFTTGTFHPGFAPGEWWGERDRWASRSTPVAVFYLVAMLVLGPALQPRHLVGVPDARAQSSVVQSFATAALRGASPILVAGGLRHHSGCGDPGVPEVSCA